MIDINDAILRLSIKGHEGVKAFPYRCLAGKLTIGVGRNLEDNGISEAEIEYLLDSDLTWALEEAQGLTYWHELTDNRQRVIVEMLFQLGWRGFRSFRRMNDALEAEDYDSAADEILDSRAAREQAPSRFQYYADRMRQG